VLQELLRRRWRDDPPRRQARLRPGQPQQVTQGVGVRDHHAVQVRRHLLEDRGPQVGLRRELAVGRLLPPAGVLDRSLARRPRPQGALHLRQHGGQPRGVRRHRRRQLGRQRPSGAGAAAGGGAVAGEDGPARA
jgi:hypothetical protein